MKNEETRRNRAAGAWTDGVPAKRPSIDDFQAGEPEYTSDGNAMLEEILQVLSCSERMLFFALRDALRDDPGIDSRLEIGGRLLVAVHVPSRAWRATTRAAFHAFVAEATAGGRSSHGDPTTFIAERSNWKATVAVFDLASVLETVNRQHLGLVVCPDDVVPETVRISLDASAHLENLPNSFLRNALRAQFPGMDVPDVGCFASADLPPELIDNAAKRCTTPAEVLRLLEKAATYEKTSPHSKRSAEKPKNDPAPRGFAATEILRPASPKLSDLHGYGEAGAWGKRFCEDVADYRAGRIRWSDVDAGCLLSGPPGTGKTLFAAALAASADLPLIVTSYSDWQSQGEAHGGTLIKTMRMRFKDAAEAAPCIMFIDEIDAIPARGNGGRNSDWWTPILTTLLESLDGSSRREGLLVMAACNHPETLDPALVRSGRLDRRFVIGLPSEDDLLRIFLHHLPGLSEGDVAPAATALAGICSGADVSRISREARRIARRADREPTASDLVAVALPPDHRPAAMRRLAAVHEAGHAVAFMSFGLVPRSLSIVGGGGTHGGVVMPDENGGLGRIEDIDRMVVPMLCGRAAEEVVFGKVSAGAGGPASSDLARATSLIADSIGTFGIGGRLSHDAPVDPAQVELRLRRLYAEALLLMSKHKSDVVALADIALERRVMGERLLSAFRVERGICAGRND